MGSLNQERIIENFGKALITHGFNNWYPKHYLFYRSSNIDEHAFEQRLDLLNSTKGYNSVICDSITSVMS